MPVLQNRISGEIVSDFAETGLQRRLAARAADTGFGVANDARLAPDYARVDQGLDRQVRSSRIAAGIRDQPRAGNAGAAELGKPVGCLRQQAGLGVRFLVPTPVVLGCAQTER